MENANKKYFICPMKCEDIKTYVQEGNCPVCKMKLVPVDGNQKNQEPSKCCS